MIHSMTAFSRNQSHSDGILLHWELRSVNHRYFDCTYRLPEQFRYLEGNLRAMMREKIFRGKLDCTLKLSELGDNERCFEIQEKLVQSLLGIGKRVASEHHLADDLSLSYILSWPGVLIEKPMDDEILEKKVEDSFLQALDKLILSRKKEGEMLGSVVKKRLQMLQGELIGIQSKVEAVTNEAQEKLKKRLNEFQVNIADARIAQECALLLVRLDISEEIERIEAHMQDVADTLESNESQGRRMDFLMQELNREVSTMCSKTDSLLISQHALQMKVWIDQMREQIQNIE